MARKFLGQVSDTSPNSASTAVGDTVISGLEDADSITLVATLAGATGGTLDVYLQTSIDDGVTWYDMAHFPQLAAAAASSVRVWKVCRSEPNATLVTIGQGTVGTPSVALAANTIVHFWGDRVRAVYVAGAGTSAGAAVDIKIWSYTK